ncbi:MAG: thiosulfate oxidation carrier protein SoxY [Roseiarcus sp.]
MYDLTRRQSFGLAAGLVVASALPTLAEADADADSKAAAARIIKNFVGSTEPKQGAVKLDLPEIAENGNTVPISIEIASPMTEQSHVVEAVVIAELNPQPRIMTLKFTPASGKAAASLRMRLAKTQVITALARMNDGSIYMDQKTVKVTVGGCGG